MLKEFNLKEKLFWLAIFIGLLVFFCYLHPIIVADMDDWQFIYVNRQAMPLIGAWNPSRMFAEITTPFISMLSSYLIYPINNDYIYSLAIGIGIFLSIFIIVYFLFAHKYIKETIGFNSKICEWGGG